MEHHYDTLLTVCE